MSIIAIKGHTKRGKEVIEILEMLGYINQHNYSGDADSLCFYSNGNTNIIYYDWINSCYEDEDVIVFTLEEFLEKYPYKVGDYARFSRTNIAVIIKAMKWENNEVVYQLSGSDDWWSVDNLKQYKEETMEDKPNLLQQLKDYFDNTPREVIEKEWREYDKYNEIGPKINEYLEYVNNIKQPKYPKTYDECCKIMQIHPSYELEYELKLFGRATATGKITNCAYTQNLLKKINNFQKLRICIDAYWKIAGEQMNLGKPWEPNWNDEEEYKFTIYVFKNNILLDGTYVYNTILAFPTPEMRDTFHENFKELIEQSKELLYYGAFSLRA